jgi:hypothetical protein
MSDQLVPAQPVPAVPAPTGGPSLWWQIGISFFTLLAIATSAASAIVTFRTTNGFNKYMKAFHEQTLRDARIALTVDISQRFLHSDIARLRDGWQAFSDARDKGADSIRTSYQMASTNGYLNYLNYLASLLEQSKIDPEYLAPFIRCEMFNVHQRAYKGMEHTEKVLMALPSKEKDIPALTRLVEAGPNPNCGHGLIGDQRSR